MVGGAVVLDPNVFTNITDGIQMLRLLHTFIPPRKDAWRLLLQLPLITYLHKKDPDLDKVMNKLVESGVVQPLNAPFEGDDLVLELEKWHYEHMYQVRHCVYVSTVAHQTLGGVECVSPGVFAQTFHLKFRSDED